MTDYENKQDENISTDNNKSLAEDHIFFLKNIFMSKEWKIMNLNNLISKSSKNKKKHFTKEVDLLENDSYAFNDVLKNIRNIMNNESKNLNNEEVRKNKLQNELKVEK